MFNIINIVYLPVCRSFHTWPGDYLNALFSVSTAVAQYNILYYYAYTGTR